MPRALQEPAAGLRLRRESSGWRTLFCATFSIFLLACTLLATVGQYEVKEIKPKVFVWIAEDILQQEGDPQFKRPGNAGFVFTPQGVVVIDTTNSPFNARDVLYEIRHRTDLPVKFVIDTNASPDLMLGNEVFEDFQPTILSTPQTQAAIERYRKALPERLDGDWRLEKNMRGIHPTAPAETFDHTMTLPVDGEEIRLLDLGPNISPSDAAVFLPRAKILFLGDIFQNSYIPWIGSGNIRHWIETLRQVETWDVDVYVPGHGAPGGKQDVTAFRKFLEWLTNAVETRIREGKSLDQIEKELLPFQNYQWHAPELEPEALEAVYQQLTASKTATPAPQVSGNR